MGLLFNTAQLAAVKQPSFLVPQCGSCGLLKTCTTPQMAVCGEGRRGILVVGEAPGETEDKQGRPFVGKTGQRLRKELDALGVDLDRDCWTTNALRCHPPGNRIPSEKTVDYCRPYLVQAVKQLKPSTILLLGSHATRSLLAWAWREDEQGLGIGRFAGFRIPSQKLNAWIASTWHPSHIERSESEDKRGVVTVLWRQHLKAALELDGRPWDELPDYPSQVDCLLDVDRAAAVLREMIRRGGSVAFDLETEGLKPDSADIGIVSCAVCWEGKKTIAYPWHGVAIAATKELLDSRLGKIGYNLKFEARFIQAKLGITVRNWIWDGMQSAHLLNQHYGVSGLKFQSFVRLGVGSYDDHIKPFLQSSEGGGNDKNKIRQVPIRDLLLYNGIDAVLEYAVAKHQSTELGVEL